MRIRKIRATTRVRVSVGVLLVALLGAFVVSAAVRDSEELVIVHWSNSHLTRDGLLPQMADRFNDDDHETSAGVPVRVEIVSCDSATQAADLVARIQGAGRAERGCKNENGDRANDPTVVTPQSRDWLVEANHRAGVAAVDLAATTDIARTWLGIVTYRAMAECLGWPAKDIGYADIVALRADPRGWAAHPGCAAVEWGRRPLLAFTNPGTSTSGRNVLVSLYAMAAGKAANTLTIADVERPDVVDSVKRFQSLVDHYLPGTIPLNTKIVQGSRFGHFFLMPEDNLVSLYKGTEKAVGPDGSEKPVPAVKDLVMLYPNEGSVLNSHPAAVVSAPWVTPEATAAASDWIDFLHDDERQRAFIREGFRPASSSTLEVDERQFAAWGLEANDPATRIEPGDLSPEVLGRIVDSWGAVKNPAIVTFVVDTSGSMRGEPLEQVKEGLRRVVDAMSGINGAASGNQVGLVTFSDGINTEVAPAPIADAKYVVADAVEQMQAVGATALYDAVDRGVRITDAAAGDPRSTRAVVVLSDGAATSGSCLDAIVAMRSRSEVPIRQFCGHEHDSAVDERGEGVAPADVGGDQLRIPHENPVQVFFLGFGDADLHVGRILAEATGAEFQGSADEDLASVIEALNGYF